jgi:hypothetical protein
MRSQAIVASVAILLTGCAVSAPHTDYQAVPPDANTPRRELTVTEKKFMAEGLSKDFKDPPSAQFRWMQIPVPSLPNSIVSYCGTVNAKNSYGGYVGFKPFIARVGFSDNKMIYATMGSIAGPELPEEVIINQCAQHNLSPSGSA